MTKAKKLTGLFLAAVTAAGLIIGCGSSGGSDTGTKAAGAAGEAKTTAGSGAAEGSKAAAGSGAAEGSGEAEWSGAAEGSGEAAPVEEFMSLGTSSSGGTFNTLGVAMCQMWNDKIPATSFSAEVTAGSSENCLRVGSDELQIAMAAASSVYEATTGTGQFEGKKVEDIRVIANLYPAIIQIPVLKKSGINTIDDIPGRKINVGEAGSGSESQAMNILKSYGITKDDFNVQQLSHSNASDAVVDEKMDGYIISGSLGQSHQMKAMSSGKCALASLGTDEEIAKLLSDYPYYYEFTIPADAYPNQDGEVKTVATGTLLIVNKSISDELVYEITKNMFENIESLAQSQDIANEISLESALNVSGIELHPGAEKYYREAGILK